MRSSDASRVIDRARRLIRDLSPLAADTVELLGAGTESEAFRVDGERVARFPLAPQAQSTLRTELALLPRLTPVLLHADIKPAHLLHDPSSGALTGLLDWGDASLGHGDFDLAIVGAFCGPQTLRGLLDRLDDADAERACASIPFLLTLRRLQDAIYEIARGGDPRGCRLDMQPDSCIK